MLKIREKELVRYLKILLKYSKKVFALCYFPPLRTTKIHIFEMM